MNLCSCVFFSKLIRITGFKLQVWYHMSKNCQEFTIHPEKVEVARKTIEKSDSSELVTFFKLLATESRIKILLALSEVELCVCDLCSTLNMEQSAISHQLSLLRRHRLVKDRRKGKQVFYSLEKEHLHPILSQTLDHLKEENN